jgi:hypothetical protein
MRRRSIRLPVSGRADDPIAASETGKIPASLQIRRRGYTFEIQV